MKRHIGLLIQNINTNIFRIVYEYCKENDLYYQFKCFRLGTYYSNNYNEDEFNKLLLEENLVPLFYFSIIGDTNDYNNFCNAIDCKILTTEHSEFCNIANLDDAFTMKLEETINILKNNINTNTKSNNVLLNLLMPIKDRDTLIAFEKMYGCYLTDFQKKIIRDRIDVINGESHFEEEILEFVQSLDCDVLKLRKQTNMNRKQFATYFGIPYRTVEDWENKKSNISSYLFNLMVEKLKKENLLINS